MPEKTFFPVFESYGGYQFKFCLFYTFQDVYFFLGRIKYKYFQFYVPPYLEFSITYAAIMQDHDIKGPFENII